MNKIRIIQKRLNHKVTTEQLKLVYNKLPRHLFDINDDVLHHYLSVNKGIDGEYYLWYLDAYYDECLRLSDNVFVNSEEVIGY